MIDAFVVLLAQVQNSTAELVYIGRGYFQEAIMSCSINAKCVGDEKVRDKGALQYQ